MSLYIPKGQLTFVDWWPLINPSEMAFILITYPICVLKIGPIITEGRSAFQTKGILIFYNSFKVINSSTLGYKFLLYILENGLFPSKCEHNNLKLYIIASLYWKYMVTKVLDLFDTVFFIIRKKYDHVTFLHMYHHVFMVVIAWLCLKYDPSDHWAFMASINCIIHGIISTHYGITSLGPGYEKYIWWKKYLTLVQSIQFVLVIAHLIVQVFISACPLHSSTYWIGLANFILFMLHFTDFYNKIKRAHCNKEFMKFFCYKQLH
ncbi:elongation of very long chain fatty acids protein AAEL008004-like [Galleria mellonella]|uniref:Elongation of very long chain fatty acids protein n=1 Tax=Galleria mellonella TaxID=7137 RepID=A0ABM3ME07_GALME|nr:elongation of very long chain fatty acids protein AAEL008004-like [Galleria mellonella]